MNRPLAILTLLLAACGGDATEADTEAIGAATYRDAETNADGSEREPATVSNDFELSIEIEGTATFSGVEPTCLDGATGSFEGVLEGAATIDDGVYVSALAESSATLATPSGCEIPQLEIGALSKVVVRGRMEATTSRCETYCEAKARSHGEAMCAAANDEAQCRAAAEGEYIASCQTSCDRREQQIVAEIELDATARAELAAQAASGLALGTFDADLVFELIADAEGNVVAETP